jgi:hypothetical protein
MNQFEKIVTCPKCKGTGKKTSGSCHKCGGNKIIKTTIDQTKKAKKEAKLQYDYSINEANIKFNIDMNNIKNNIKQKKKLNKKKV